MQDHSTTHPGQWRETVSLVLDARALRMLLLGFSSGLPILLVFSTLSVWLIRAGVERSVVTFFSWAGIAYAFKFVWSPLIDRIPLPILASALGHRRGWLLFSQVCLVAAILFTASTDPANALFWTAIGAVAIGFTSATQDIVIDAFRIESAPPRLQAMLSATYVAGYRVAMLTAGAGSLWLAAWLGAETTYDAETWKTVYRVMAGLMVVGMLATLISPEPEVDHGLSSSKTVQLRLFLAFVVCVAALIAMFNLVPGTPDGLGPLATLGYNAVRLLTSLAAAGVALYILVRLSFVPGEEARKAYVEPFSEFVTRHGKAAVAILCLIGIYRIADVVMGAVANVFYVELGFELAQIATYSKFYGLIATIAGGFLGGIIAGRIGVMRALFSGAILAAASNLLFAYLATQGADVRLLVAVITADNLSAGYAVAAFVAYLSALTNVSFTATQYALFSSIMLLVPKALAGYSGSIVDAMGYPGFFVFTALLGVPVLVLVWWAGRLAPIENGE
jgi:PAT family beta-lactamase induction signal transducer AmpG